mmetsp:Transcript_21660/g.30354  ORF Transcript_21660/g.30354 Transcript_21660/m.30354 type:complete len:709 (-) Transcript_21660:47-2173(-)
MPITPRYKLSQTPTHVVITIHVPHVRVSSSTIELDIDGTEFHFHSSPYLLHLTLPGRLLDDPLSGREAKASYDPCLNDGTLTVEAWKEDSEDGHDVSLANHSGPVISHESSSPWNDLDLMARLQSVNDGMTTTGTRADKNITVLSSTSTSTHSLSNKEDSDDDKTKQEELTAAKEINIHDILREELDDGPRYGFNNAFRSVFRDFARSGLSKEMMELPEPDITPEDSRRNMRWNVEEQMFDPQRYLGDTFLSPEDDPIYYEAMHMTPHWKDARESVTRRVSNNGGHEKDKIGITVSDMMKSLSISRETKACMRTLTEQERSSLASTITSSPNAPFFTDKEFQLLSSITTNIRIPKYFKPVSSKNHPVSSKNHDQYNSIKYNDTSTLNNNDITERSENHTLSQILLSLTDILYAYAYDHRTTLGEPTCESSWTTSILSPTLSWFEAYNTTISTSYDTIATAANARMPSPQHSVILNTTSIKDALKFSIRRALTYPYLRNWDFVSIVLVQDVFDIFSSGHRTILRCLLQLHEIFERSEAHYLLNKLYIDPYICWIREYLDISALEHYVQQWREQIFGIRGDPISKKLIGFPLLDLEKEALQLESDRDNSTNDFSSEDGNSNTSFVNKTDELKELDHPIKNHNDESVSQESNPDQNLDKFDIKSNKSLLMFEESTDKFDQNRNKDEKNITQHDNENLESNSNKCPLIEEIL